MKKILLLTWLILLTIVALAFANPICDRCGHEMTRVPCEIGDLYICRDCAKDIIVDVEIEDDTREKIDEKNKERKNYENIEKN